jgi:hypothetical protein
MEMTEVRAAARAMVREWYASNLAEGADPLYAAELVIEAVVAQGRQHGWGQGYEQFTTAGAEALVGEALAERPRYTAPAFESADDVRDLINRLRPVLLLARRPLDRRFVTAVLAKMHRMGRSEVFMGAEDWRRIPPSGVSPSAGQRALERFCKPEVQPHLIRTTKPRMRGNVKEQEKRRVQGQRPRMFYRIRQRGAV